MILDQPVSELTAQFPASILYSCHDRERQQYPALCDVDKPDGYHFVA